MKSLWPDLGKMNKMSNPVIILREQGVHLEKDTEGVLTFDIKANIFDNDDSPSKRAIRTEFFIRAPHLQDYKFLLFYIIHDFLATYPIT